MSLFSQRVSTHSASEGGQGNHLDHDSVVSHALEGGSSSSSKAVLAALRALQDKIRRLETDRAKALEETEALRNRLKGLEVEAEQTRSRDDAVAQRNIQEARSTYDRLMAEKNDLEVRLARAEDRRGDIRSSSAAVDRELRRLREEKESALLKIREGEAHARHMDQQLMKIYQREKELSLSLQHESVRHAETMSQYNERLTSLQSGLIIHTQTKSAQDAKIAELDHLVGQLLAVNETLVSKLTGKSVHGSETNKSKKKNTKKGTSSSSPRAAEKAAASIHSAKYARQQSAAIAAAARALADDAVTPNVVKNTPKRSPKKKNSSSKLSPRTESPRQGDVEKFRVAKDVRNIEGVNKLYHELVRELVSSPPSPEQQGSGKKKKDTSAQREFQYTGAGLVAQSAGSRAALRAAQAETVNGYSSPSTFMHRRRLEGSPTSPAAETGVTDEDFLLHSETKDKDGAENMAHIAVHVPSVRSSSSPTTIFSTASRFSPDALRDAQNESPSKATGSLVGDLESRAGPYMDEVAALEAKFQALDAQYHTILSGTDANDQNAAASSADLLVDVIRRLHETGQQLRDLRSSPYKPPSQ